MTGSSNFRMFRAATVKATSAIKRDSSTDPMKPVNTRITTQAATRFIAVRTSPYGQPRFSATCTAIHRKIRATPGNTTGSRAAATHRKL
jgi:hypothetical protein